MHRSLSRGGLAILFGIFVALGLVGTAGTAGTAGAAGSTGFGSQVAATQWTATNPPSIPPSESYDDSVSCVSSSFCVATVLQQNDSPNGNVQVWDGSTWSTQQTPGATGASATQLFSVSCTSLSFCVVVGIGITGDGPNQAIQPFTTLWNGTSWSIGPAVSIPSGFDAAFLESVSCTGPGSCLAVGNATITATGASQAFAAQWNGSTWTSSLPDVPGAAASTFLGVSCTTPTNCMAVGATSPNNVPFALPHTASGAGAGAGAGNGSFGLRPRGLQAGGDANQNANAEPHAPAASQVLAEQWNGSSWTVSPTGTPANVMDPVFEAVSCAGNGFCMATGIGEANPLTSFTEEWSAGTWSEAPLPASTTGGPVIMEGINCISPTSCTAVGEATLSPDLSTAGGTFVSASWNGSTWASTLEALPAGVTAAAWFGISCLTGGFCMTAGGLNTITGPNGTLVPSNAQAPIGRSGYRIVASDGGLFSYTPAAPSPGAPFLGSMGGTRLNAPIVGMATMPSGDGYYLVAADGGVFTFGSATFDGSAGSTHLNAPIVGMAVTADGGGYWLVAADGGIFSYGDAQFYGSTGSIHLNKPIVGMAATPNGRGYYLVASDGGVFTYGNGVFAGSPAGSALNSPVVGMAVTPAGGYYLAASDGGVFAYGGAPFLGSAGRLPLNKPVVGLGVSPGGYYLVASDGGIFTYPGAGGPSFFGSAGGTHLNAPIVGIGT